MTNKQAKEIMLKLKEEIANDFDVLEDEEKEAFNKAIEALEQEPCDDAVSRQYLIDIATKDGAYDYVSAQEIANAPSVRPQEPTGHWIIDKGSLDAFYGEVCKCSECGVESIGESDYCPNCGAKMEGGA